MEAVDVGPSVPNGGLVCVAEFRDFGGQINNGDGTHGEAYRLSHCTLWMVF